jgi:hypothetical protein
MMTDKAMVRKVAESNGIEAVRWSMVDVRAPVFRALVSIGRDFCPLNAAIRSGFVDTAV